MCVSTRTYLKMMADSDESGEKNDCESPVDPGC